MKFKFVKIFSSHPDAFKQRVLRDLVILIAIATMSIITLYSLRFFKIKKTISISHINQITVQPEMEIKNFFNPITGSLTLIQKWGRSGMINITNTLSLTSSFIPMLEQIPYIFSLAIANSKGCEYILYKVMNRWVTRRIKPEKKKTKAILQNWHNGKVIAKSQEYVRYDPRQMLWYINAMKNPYEDRVCWMESSIILITKRPTITGLKKWTEKGQGETYMVGVNILLEDIAGLLKSLNISKSAKVFLLNKEKLLIGFSFNRQTRTEKNNKIIKVSSLKSLRYSDISDILNEWRKNRQKMNMPFRFKSKGKFWWGKFIHLTNAQESMIIGISIPEFDLLTEIQSQRKSSIYIFLSVLFIGILLILLFSEVYHRQMEKSKVNRQSAQYSEKQIFVLIKKGENNKLEFKSSLRWDFNNKTANKKMEEVILKSIAAFNNSDGGTLIIGVNDKKEIVGLEMDYSTLKEGNKDHFELHLRNLINSAYGIEYAANNLVITFIKVQDKEICIIEIQKGKKPLYTIVTDKHGERHERFYLRSGNSSQEFSKLSEIAGYVNNRFKGNNA